MPPSDPSHEQVRVACTARAMEMTGYKSTLPLLTNATRKKVNLDARNTAERVKAPALILPKRRFTKVAPLSNSNMLYGGTKRSARSATLSLLALRRIHVQSACTESMPSRGGASSTPAAVEFRIATKR